MRRSSAPLPLKHSAICPTTLKSVYIAQTPEATFAEWHSDANHNFTIQLTGVKDWQVVDLPEDPTSLLLRGERSRGLFDAPHNRAEQLLGTTATAAAKSYSLAPGSVLYVPPGHPHRVVPSAGGSLSVDVRIGHISHAKWVSEVLYASLMHAALSHSPRCASSSPLQRCYDCFSACRAVR